ncbi:MAG: hypothetical protein HQ471_00315 [Flavobacteriales bacterium]|nr:hypothetical protein [Flavobacteriales bacterium]
MDREKIAVLYKKYELTKDDVFKHQHYLIITRSGIDKIQALEKIKINYEVIKCETNFAVIKATSGILETFGSALKGESFKDGNTNSWYVMEMAEKRAMSRIVLKLTGFYELGIFGEDESEDFKRK